MSDGTRRLPFRFFNLSPEARTFVWGEVGSRRWEYAGFFVLSLIAAVIEMTGVGLIFPLLIIVISPGMIERIPAVADLMAALGFEGGTDFSIFLLCVIGAVLVGKNAYMLFFNWLQMNTLARWKTDLSRRLIGSYLYADYSLHLAKTSSEVIRNMSLITQVFDQFFAATIQLIVNAVILAGLVVLLVWILPSETLFSLVLIAVAAWTLYVTMRKPFEDIGAELNALFRKRQAILRQSIGMMKETKLSAKEDFFLDAYIGIEQRNFHRNARYNFMSTIPPLVTEGSIIVAILSIITYLLFLSSHQDMGLALLGLLAATLFRLTPVINRTMTALQKMNLGRNAVDIIAKEFAELEGQVFRPEVEPAPLPFEERLRLEGVGYAYPGTEVRAVHGVDVEIRKGERIGITGPSGAGKSTLIALLMGLVPPAEGRILVDGVPLDSPERLRAWHKHLGFVPQGIFLIEDTIAHNVAFGYRPHEIDEARVWKALEVAQMSEFVSSLPDGIHAFIGEDGAKLSGGQRQRLGIARGLYENPGVLVLDEATSGLDAANERAFTDSLRQMHGSRTLVMIAHRLSTLRDCDRIIMLDRGTVIDIAPFDVLNDRCPSFRRLVELSSLERAS